MENAQALPKSKMTGRRLVKVVALVSVSLMSLLFAARLIWRFSGSNQWELVGERNGVTVYSLKAPGSDLIQVKGVVRVRSKLAGLVNFMVDPATCDDYGCYESHTVERVDDRLQYSSFRVNFPFPFKTRELVVRSEVDQDPRTKEVLLVVAAAPDKTPPNNCCFRVTEMNNTWRLTPLGNGQVEIAYVMNMNEGGYLPDLLLNTQRPKLVFGVLGGLQRLLDREKIQNAKLDFIQEE